MCKRIQKKKCRYVDDIHEEASLQSDWQHAFCADFVRGFFGDRGYILNKYA